MKIQEKVMDLESALYHHLVDLEENYPVEVNYNRLYSTLYTNIYLGEKEKVKILSSTIYLKDKYTEKFLKNLIERVLVLKKYLTPLKTMPNVKNKSETGVKEGQSKGQGKQAVIFDYTTKTIRCGK